MVMILGFLKVTFPSNTQEESIAILFKALLNAVVSEHGLSQQQLYLGIVRVRVFCFTQMYWN